MPAVEILEDRAATIVGINIGGTNTTVVGGLEDGRIVARWSAPTLADDGELLLRSVVAAAHAVGPQATLAGVAVGGPLDVRRGVITEAVHLPGLHGMPLRDRIAEELEIPVNVHHDAAACALAEWRWGPNAGVAGLAYLTCGTGFGTGLVLDGRVRYAPDGRSPEIGHIRYRDEGPPIFGKPGCYEGFASANALALLFRFRDPSRAVVTPAQVIDEIRDGNDAALWALRQNERAVGMACALLADLLVLDTIVLGTLAAHLGTPWIEAVKETFREEVLGVNAEACVIRSAMPDVQDRSALAAALTPAIPPAAAPVPSTRRHFRRRG